MCEGFALVMIPSDFARNMAAGEMPQSAIPSVQHTPPEAALPGRWPPAKFRALLERKIEIMATNEVDKSAEIYTLSLHDALPI